LRADILGEQSIVRRWEGECLDTIAGYVDIVCAAITTSIRHVSVAVIALSVDIDRPGGAAV